MIIDRQTAMSCHRYGIGWRWRPLVCLVMWWMVVACVEHQPSVNPVDVSMNLWIGKSKDERVQIAGAPTQCTNLKTGEEICDWVRRGPYDVNIDCPADGMYGGHPCRRTEGLQKHHLIFQYDRQGIARRWTYWEDGGKRASSEMGESRDSGLKEARMSGR